MRKAGPAPEAGPKILFLSGGSALRELSRVLKHYTHNSIHLVTPFDSGGSSATLRTAFGMLSVGDLGDRLLALTDESSPRADQIHELLHHRLDKEAPAERLLAQIGDLIAGRDPLIEDVPETVSRMVREQLERFADHMPAGFDLRGASLGNLVLAGGYLEDRDIEMTLARFSNVLGVLGRVLPTVDADLHLAARLADGTRVVGQHRLSGKEHAPLAQAIEDLCLVDDLDPAGTSIAHPPASPAAIRCIGEADLICYPMGSFYSSLLCNLLPSGIGRAIAAAGCLKVYVPSTGDDPELVGLDPAGAAAVLVDALRRDAGEDTAVGALLERVLLDTNPESYPDPADLARLDALGVQPISAELVTDASRPGIDPQRLASLLLALCSDVREDSREASP